jgi:hypothetical protein
MALPTDLTTVADFKSAQNVQTTADDAWIQQLITRATAWIENQTNRKFVARQYNGNSTADQTKTHATTKVTDEDYLYIDGSPSLVDRDNQSWSFGRGLYYLPQYPVQQNTVLPFALAVLTSRDQTGDTWDTTSLLESRDYLVDRATGTLRLLGGPFQTGLKNYRVTFAAGYALGGQAPWVPRDLQQLTIDMANQIYRDKRQLTQETVGVWSRQWDLDKDDPFISGTLGAYQRFIIV